MPEAAADAGAGAAVDAPSGYVAFLSYSHQDRRLAGWLHRALETFAVPRGLVGQPSPIGPVPRRLRPVFQDRAELRAGADLGERLRAALDRSAWLIVVCSPAAARSRWVGAEIARFRERGLEDRILAVIASGEPFAPADRAEAECMPPALRGPAHGGAAGAEPAAADLRAHGDGRRRALLKLVAGIIDVDLDALVRRDQQRRQRQLLALTAASCVATAVTGGLAVTAALERNRALMERDRAEGLIEFMIGDLDRRLEPMGRLSVLDAIGRRALDYYAAERPGPMDADALARRARVLQMLGEVQEKREDLAAAERSFRDSAASTAELLRRAPRDPARIFDHAQSRFYLGEIAMARGDDAAALASLERYKALAAELVTVAPGDPRSWEQIEEAEEGVGALLERLARPQAALAEFEAALAVGQRLAAQAPMDRDRWLALAQIYAWVADAEASEGAPGPALGDRAKEAAIYERLLARSPGDADFAVDLDSSRIEAARLRLRQGAVVSVVPDLRRALADLDRQMALAPENRSYQKVAAPGVLLLAAAEVRRGSLDAAAASARRAAALGGATGGPATVLAAQTLLVRIAAARAKGLAARRLALAPATALAGRLQPMLAREPKSPLIAFYAAEAWLLAGDRASLSASPGAARRCWRTAASDLRRLAAIRRAPPEPTQALLREIGSRLSSAESAPGAGRPVRYDW